MGKPKKHKRGRRKNARAGCLLCKPWKVNGVKAKNKTTIAEQRQLQRTTDQED